MVCLRQTSRRLEKKQVDILLNSEKKKESKLQWYIYTMEYYSAIKKNTFESVLLRWMKLEPIIQSEVSQKEKHHYSIITYIWNLERW